MCLNITVITPEPKTLEQVLQFETPVIRWKVVQKKEDNIYHMYAQNEPPLAKRTWLMSSRMPNSNRIPVPRAYPVGFHVLQTKQDAEHIAELTSSYSVIPVLCRGLIASGTVPRFRTTSPAEIYREIYIGDPNETV